MGPQFPLDVDRAISDAARLHGVDERTMRAFARIESGGNPRNVTGSYRGLFQLSGDEFRRHGGQGDIFDPIANSDAYARKLKTNSDEFSRKYGRTPTPADLYLVHQQGEGGYQAHTSNPDRPAWQNMASTAEGRAKGPAWAKQAIWGNVPDDVKARYGSVDNLTSRDFIDLWTQKVGRFSGDNAMTGMSDNPVLADIRTRFAGPDGSLAGGTPDADAFLKRYGIDLGSDAKGLLGVYALQRDMMRDALQQKPVTWGQGIGEALKAAGAIMTARNDPKLGMQLAGTVGQDYRERANKIDDLTLTSAMQQAHLLGTSLDAAIKAQMEARRKQKELRERAQFIEGGNVDGGGSGSTGTAAATPSAIPAPVVASPIPPAAPPGAAAASPIPPAGQQVSSAQPSPAVGSPANGGVVVQPVVPPVGAVPPPSAEVQRLREQARRAALLGEDKTAKLKLDEAEAREKIEIERWKLETEAPRKGAETAASQAARSAGDEAAKIQKARENADKLANLYDGLRAKSEVPGLESVIGPFDNSWAGRWVANVNPFGPSGENAGLRSQIEGDMKAIAAIGKDITRKPGEGTWTDKDQEGLEAAIGAVLDAPNKAAYLKALEESQKRMEKLLGVALPRTSTGADKAAEGKAGGSASALSVASPADLMKVPEGQTILFRGQPYVRRGSQLVPVEAPAAPPAAPRGASMSTMQGFGLPGQE